MTQRVFGFHYTLKDKEGNVIDSSENTSPLLFLEESGQIIPGLEKEIIDLEVGDKKNIEVKAAEAYGDIIEDLRITVQRSQFPEGQELNVGDQFQVTNEAHAPIFTVIEIEGDNVHVDGNHPLAGHDLFFDIEVTEKRNATEEELAHGHAHGVGGHNH
ncbi:MAG: peptidylprolyl isomerase [Bdellovibrionota bacterium]|nr:peptidylprolyl isomerase [Bdellovibrionota bacterium]